MALFFKKNKNVKVKSELCLFCVDSVALLMLNEKHSYLLGQI